VKILMVLTSHDVLGNTGRKTGFWLEEFAAPCFVSRAIVDGRLVTGQNPASSTAAAKTLLKLLGRPATTWTSVEVSHLR
jgi:putative intracellular protease/amidase